MEKKIIPQWALKYKTKGFTVRPNGNGYALYKVSSYREKGCSYPKIKQEYIASIDEQLGLIPKKSIRYDNTLPLEYGLSNIILLNFKRTLAMSLFNGGSHCNDIILLGIIYFMFGNVDENSIKLSYISKSSENIIEISKTTNIKRIEKISNKIESEFELRIKDPIKYSYLINALKLITVPSYFTGKVQYPNEIKKLCEEYKIKYE